MPIWNDDKGYFDLIKDEDRYGIFLDVGEGKTALMLQLIDYNFFNYKIKKVLIITPPKVSKATWQNEMNKWDNFRYMLQYTKLLSGNEQERNEKILNSKEYEIHIISSNVMSSLVGHTERYGKDNKRKKFVLNENIPEYDLIIIDECSFFKDTTTARFKAISKIKINKLFLLSATAWSNVRFDEKLKSYIKADEIYYVFFLLNIYNKSLYSFQLDFCFSNKWEHAQRMNPTVYDNLINTLKNCSISSKSELKKTLVKEYKIYIEMDEDSKKIMFSMIDEMSVEIGNETITAFQKADMISKSLQISNGFVYDFEKNVKRINQLKLDKLKEIIDICDDNVLVIYSFIEDKEFILANISDSILYSSKIEEDWNNGKIHVMLLHASSSHGLNIQFGSHTAVWYGLTFSEEAKTQTNGRLPRNGQTSPLVSIYYLMTTCSYDDYVFDVVLSKEKVIDDFKLATSKILKEVRK